MSWFNTLPRHRNTPPAEMPKRFIEMTEEERIALAEELEAKYPSELTDPANKEEWAINRVLRTMEATDPMWRVVLMAARANHAEVFAKGRNASPDAILRSFRRLHERQGKKEEQQPPAI